MREQPITIGEADIQRLRQLLSNRNATGRDQEHLQELSAELERAYVLEDAQVPADVVTMGSRVGVLDRSSGQRREYTLVYPADADLGTHRISVLAPLGTALLGFREGEEVEWRMPGGLRRLRIENVIQPVSFGAFTREFADRHATDAPSKSRYTFLALAATAFLTLGSVALHPASAAADVSPAASRAATLKTQMALRDLWVEHIFWIRSYVLASHADDEAQRKIAEGEVVSNAKVLASAIEPYYGQSASAGLLTLLAGHWGAVREFNAATLKKSQSSQDQAVAKLTSNARDIAKFLSGANPNLPEETVFGLLSGHGGHHVAQIKQIAAGDFHGEAGTWHAMREHMLVISDAIADALAKQFPDRFQATL